MSKTDREAEARVQGMDYAYRQIKAHGLEAFERELHLRGHYGIRLPITPRDIMDCYMPIRNALDDMYRSLTLVTLHDEFDFGAKRLQRFRDRWNVKVSDIDDKIIDVADYVKVANDLLGQRAI